MNTYEYYYCQLMLKFNYFLIIYVVNRRPQEEENSQETLFSKSNKSNKIPSGV